MGKTIEELRQLDTNKYDWYKCKECGEPEFLPKKNFLREVAKRNKTCGDCRVRIEMEKSTQATIKKRAERKAARKVSA